MTRAALWVLLVGACRPAPPPPPPADAAPPDAHVALAPPPPEREYVGSKVCRVCHADKHAAWSKSWHAHALAAARPGAVVGDFRARHFAGNSNEAWMTMAGGAYTMRTAGPDGKLADFPIAWVIGGKRMQDTVTVFPDGRWQVLPVYFHVRDRQWVDYTETKQGALTPDHPFYWTNFRRTANHECLDCHTSGLEVSYDRATSRFTTRFADAGVACESCHGPGSVHAESMEVADIVQPAKLDEARQLAVCAQCHGPRSPLFSSFDGAHHFRPGDLYDDAYQAIGLVSGRERSADFFVDGRPSSSSFEYQALLQSRCHRLGGATCLSCHTAPHEKHGGAELVSDRADETCRGCHAPIFAAGRAHTHHRGAAAQRCVACHMPPTVSGVLDKFVDHSLGIPDPVLTAEHAVPNACNACHDHAAEAPATTAAALARLWPDAAARQQRRRRLAAAVDERRAGDSLAPLLAVIGDADEAPLLRGSAAVLLADRYPRDAAPALLPLLRAAEPPLRASAAEGLGVTRSRDAAPHLLPLALGDPSLRVRIAASLALFELGAYDSAERSIVALAADPRGRAVSSVHMMLGLLALRHHDLTAAEHELQTAVTLMPYHTEALLALADVHAAQGRTAEARHDVEEVLRFDPRNQGAKDRAQALLP